MASGLLLVLFLDDDPGAVRVALPSTLTLQKSMLMLSSIPRSYPIPDREIHCGGYVCMGFTSRVKDVK
jgi:hypothetical protein